jgi:hypothetical protein
MVDGSAKQRKVGLLEDSRRGELTCGVRGGAAIQQVWGKATG